MATRNYLTRYNLLDINGTIRKVRDLSLNPVQIGMIDDTNTTGYFATEAGQGNQRFMELSYKTEVKANPRALALGLAVPDAAELKACGFTETLNASTSSVYALSSAPNNDRTLISTAARYFGAPLSATDGYVERAASLAGNLVISGAANDRLIYEWMLRGQYVRGPLTSTVNASVQSAGDPIPAINGTIGFGAGALPVGSTHKLRSFSINIGNDVVMPDDLTEDYGYGTPILLGPNASYEFLVLKDKLTDWNWWDLFQESGKPCAVGTQINFDMQWGCVSKAYIRIQGQFKISAPPEIQDQGGIAYDLIRGKNTQLASAVLTITYT